MNAAACSVPFSSLAKARSAGIRTPMTRALSTVGIRAA